MRHTDEEMAGWGQLVAKSLESCAVVIGTSMINLQIDEKKVDGVLNVCCEKLVNDVKAFIFWRITSCLQQLERKDRNPFDSLGGEA